MYNTVLHTFAKEYNNVKRKNEGSFKKNFILKNTSFLSHNYRESLIVFEHKLTMKQAISLEIN